MNKLQCYKLTYSQFMNNSNKKTEPNALRKSKTKLAILAPYLSKTELAYKTGLHYNTIDNYLAGRGRSEDIYSLIYLEAEKLFTAYRKTINSIKL